MLAVFAIVVYLAANGVILGFLAFLAGLGPWTIDAGDAGGHAVLVDLGLVLLFGVQHSLMARPAFKRWWTRFVPPAAERSVYVLASSLALVALIVLWQPLPGTVWQVTGALAGGLNVLFVAGAMWLFAACLQIDGLHLGGVRQALEAAGWMEPRHDEGLVARGLYRVMRHPIQAGWLAVLWITPSMSSGHLLLAVSMSVYIGVGIVLEERGLLAQFGEAYAAYQRRVGAFWPAGLGRGVADVLAARRRRPTEHGGQALLDQEVEARRHVRFDA
jgi:protein-S-isoprenylcysteine O-methyltransferase Ste14